MRPGGGGCAKQVWGVPGEGGCARCGRVCRVWAGVPRMGAGVPGVCGCAQACAGVRGCGAGVGTRVNGRGWAPGRAWGERGCARARAWVCAGSDVDVRVRGCARALASGCACMGVGHVLQKVVPGLTLRPRQRISPGRWHVLQKVVPGVTLRPQQSISWEGGTSCRK